MGTRAYESQDPCFAPPTQGAVAIIQLLSNITWLYPVLSGCMGRVGCVLSGSHGLMKKPWVGRVFYLASG